MIRRAGLLAAVLLGGCLRFQAVHDAGLAQGRPVATVGGDELRFAEWGAPDAAEVVLFVHGFGSSLESWEPVSPLLCASRRCVGVDLKGFGLSSRYDGDYSPAAQADALAELLDVLGVARAHVLAHSYGCAVALRLVLDHPERVDHLVLTDAFAYHEQMPWFFAWSRPPGAGELLFGLFYDQQLDYRASLAFHDPELVSHELVRRSYRAMRKPGSRAAALATVRGLDLDQAQLRYHSIAAPTLLVWGVEDQVTPLRWGQRLVKHLPDSRLETIDQAGHFPMVEAPLLYADLVQTFLEERP